MGTVAAQAQAITLRGHDQGDRGAGVELRSAVWVCGAAGRGVGEGGVKGLKTFS